MQKDNESSRSYTGPPPPPPTDTAFDRPSGVRERSRRRAVSGSRAQGREWALVIIAAALVSVAVISTGLVALFLTINEEPQEILPTAVLNLPTPVDARQDFSGVDLSLVTGSRLTLVDGSEIIITPWDGQSRFTVLVMGLDRRPGETGLAYRTDTMMLVSLDPATNSLGVLSIPRDLYVSVPGYGELQRVNTPMVLGELQRRGFGPELAMQTVQYNLGMRVHDYVAVDFNGFIQFIDTIGGITVETTYTINDPQYPSMNYGYDPFYLPPGVHELDGATALKFARTRHGSSDFRRAQRQQQVLYAVRDRLLEPGALANLIVNAPSLWVDFQENVSTGLTLDQIIQLTLYLKDIPEENISTGVISEQYVFNYSTPSGAAVLVPDRNRIGPLMVDVLGETYNE